MSHGSRGRLSSRRSMALVEEALMTVALALGVFGCPLRSGGVACLGQDAGIQAVEAALDGRLGLL